MTQTHFVVSVLFLRENEGWVAQCLEYDIAAQGATIPKAKNAFERTFVGQILVDLEKGKQPLQGIQQAPPSYWEKFEHGERLMDRRPFRLPDTLPPAFMIAATADDLRISG